MITALALSAAVLTAPTPNSVGEYLVAPANAGSISITEEPGGAELAELSFTQIVQAGEVTVVGGEKYRPAHIPQTAGDIGWVAEEDVVAWPARTEKSEAGVKSRFLAPALPSEGERPSTSVEVHEGPSELTFPIADLGTHWSGEVGDPIEVRGEHWHPVWVQGSGWAEPTRFGWVPTAEVLSAEAERDERLDALETAQQEWKAAQEPAESPSAEPTATATAPQNATEPSTPESAAEPSSIPWEVIAPVGGLVLLGGGLWVWSNRRTRPGERSDVS